MSYIQKLKEKSITTKPLEDYIDYTTKILHQCECGGIWKCSPNNVLKGNKCRIYCATNNYKKLLIINDIKVIPLEKYKKKPLSIKHKCECGEEYTISPKKVLSGTLCNVCEYKKRLPDNIVLIGRYKGLLNSVKHKCECGNIWDGIPSNILRGGRCGCKRVTHTREFYKDKKTILYHITVNGIDKVGITLYNRDIHYSIYKKRFVYDIRHNVDIKVINTIVFNDGVEAFDKEKEILYLNKDIKYSNKYNDMNWFSGYTELFTESRLFF